MKFFAALKAAEFAKKLCAAAGFDFDAAMAAGNENALKAFVANATTKGIADNSKNAGLPEQITALETALDDATAENKTLLVSANSFTVINGALQNTGFTFKTNASLPMEQQITDCKESLDAHVKLRAAAILGTTGHKPIDDKGDEAAGGAKKMSRSAFNALSHKEQSAFCKEGGRLTD